MADSRPHKRARLSFTDDITVLVGPDEIRFTVYKNEICARSEFFKAACSERWTKSEQSEAIELSDDEPELFNLFLHCVYKNEVELGSPDPPIDDKVLREEWEECQLVRLYILADKLQDTISANLVMDSLIQSYKNDDLFPSLKASSIVASNTATESPLRRLIIDSNALESQFKDLKELCESESVPREFSCEVLLRRAEVLEQNKSEEIRSALDSKLVAMRSECRYRQHDGHEPCGRDCVNRQLAEDSDEDEDSD